MQLTAMELNENQLNALYYINRYFFERMSNKDTDAILHLDSELDLYLRKFIKTMEDEDLMYGLVYSLMHWLNDYWGKVEPSMCPVVREELDTLSKLKQK